MKMLLVLYLHKFLEFTLHIFQTSDILPCYCGYLDSSLSQSTWVALTQSPLDNTIYNKTFSKPVLLINYRNIPY